MRCSRTAVVIGGLLAVVWVLAGLGVGAQERQEWLVTSEADRGEGTLRWAIAGANASDGGDVIRFASAMTIRPRSALPTLSDGRITIAGADAPEPVDTAPRVWLDGAQAGDAAGLELGAADGVVRGLGIVGFARYGIGVIGTEAVDAVILGNWIGLRADGEAAPNQLGGVAVLGGAAGAQIGRNRLGGNSVRDHPAGAERGLTGHGVVVGGEGSVAVQIVDNVIGIAPDGRAAPNDDGILIVDAAQAEIRGNTIGNSVVAGIELRETREAVLVHGNTIGLRRDGGAAANDVGVFLGPGSVGAAIGGGAIGGGANVVAGNRVGIAVEQGAREAVIEANWIGIAPPRGQSELTAADLPRAAIVPNRERGVSVIAGAAAVQVRRNYIAAGDYGIVIDGAGTSDVSLSVNVIAGARSGPSEAAIDVRAGAGINIGGDRGYGNDVCGADYGIRIANTDEVRVNANRVGAGAASRVTFDSDAEMRWGIYLSDGVRRAKVHENYIAAVADGAITVVGADAQDNNLTDNRFGWNGIDIDLGDDGVSENDPGDRDRGPNGRLNRPLIHEHSVRRINATQLNSTFRGTATPGSHVRLYQWRDERWRPIARSSRRADQQGMWTASAAVVPTAAVRALAVTSAGATSEFSDVFLPSQRVPLSSGVVQFAWTGPELPPAEAFQPLARWLETVWRWDGARSRWDGWSPRAPEGLGGTLQSVRTGDVVRLQLSSQPPRDFFVPSGGSAAGIESWTVAAGFNTVGWLGGRVSARETLARLEAASPGVIGELWQWDGGAWQLVWPQQDGSWDPGRWEFPVFWLRAEVAGVVGPPAPSP